MIYAVFFPFFFEKKLEKLRKNGEICTDTNLDDTFLWQDCFRQNSIYTVMMQPIK